MNENNFTDMTIGERLSYRLEKLNLKAIDVTQLTGISKNAISNYLNDHRVPAPDMLVKLSDLLEVSIDWILTGKDYDHLYENLNSQTYSCTPKDEISDSYLISIGKKISYIRLKSGMNEEEFSNELGIDKKALAEFEEGKVPIPAYILYAIYKKFNINPAFLLDPEVVSDKSPQEDISKSMVELEKESLYFYKKLPEDEKEEITRLVIWKYEKLLKRDQKDQSSTLNNGEGEEVVTKEMA